jgi:hypothetical protein
VNTRSPLQLNALAKAVVLTFFGLCVVWGAANYVLVREVYLHWLVLAVNGVLAIVLGWAIYRRTRHAVFCYDGEGFEIEVGGRKASGLWRDFSDVSLLHLGHGLFVVRLYKGGEACVEIPASALRLDPSAFRFEVMDLVKGSA